MKQTAIYRIANRIIEVGSLHSMIHEQYRDYRAAGFPDFTLDFIVEIAPSDVVFERERSTRADRAVGRAVQFLSNGYLETLTVYREIAEQKPDYGTALFHGSAVAVDGQTYLFTSRRALRNILRWHSMLV